MKKYPEYKDSGIEWLGEIPATWTLKPLKHISQFIVSNVDKKLNDDEIIVRLCNYSDVYNNDEIPNDLDFMKGSVKLSEFEKFKLQEGDVIITKDSETPDDIAIPAYVPVNYDDIVCGYHLAIIRNNGSMIGKYVYYLFKSYRFNQQFTVSARGITRFGLSQSAIANSIIGIPSTLEQTAIANFLDHKIQQIDDLIERKKRLIELLKEERTAVINQAVTKGLDPNVPMKDSGIEWLGEIPEQWKVKRLKYISNIVLGKMLTNEDKGGYYLKPYLRAQNLKWFNVNADDIKNMWFSERELLLYRLSKYDLLVSEGGEVGRTCIWLDEIEECYIQNSVHKVSVHKNQSPIYFLNLFYLFGTKGHFDAIVSRVSIAHLTREKLKKIEVVVPPYEEQLEIAGYIENKSQIILDNIRKIGKEIDLLTEFKTSLINEAVTGKINVQDKQVQE